MGLRRSKHGESAASAINRGWTDPITVTVGATEGAAEAIDKRGYAGGSLELSASTSLTSVTVYGAHTLGATYLPIVDKDGSTATFAVAAGSNYELPLCVYSFPFIKLVDTAVTENVSLWLTG